MFCLIPCCIGTLLGCAVGAVVRSAVKRDQQKKKWRNDGLEACRHETDLLIQQLGGPENYCKYRERLMKEEERKVREAEGIAEYQGPDVEMGSPPPYGREPKNNPKNTYRGERFYE